MRNKVRAVELLQTGLVKCEASLHQARFAKGLAEGDRDLKDFRIGRSLSHWVDLCVANGPLPYECVNLFWHRSQPR